MEIEHIHHIFHHQKSAVSGTHMSGTSHTLFARGDINPFGARTGFRSQNLR